MAMFREHMIFSSVLGVGYAAALKTMEIEPSQALLAGGLCGLSGMLPDLDSDSGRPVREIFNLFGMVLGLLTMHRLRRAGLEPELGLLVACSVYVIVRFGISYMFKTFTVHRGMFHSMPAVLIAGLIGYYFFDYTAPQPRWLLAGGVALGYLSHLVLDQIYGLGKTISRPSYRQPGTPLKLFGDSWWANLCTYGLLGLLSYAVAVQHGVVEMPSQFRQWAETAGNLRKEWLRHRTFQE